MGLGQSRLCVELNQLKFVSLTELGAGQPDGIVTVDVAEIVELDNVGLPAAFEVVLLGAVELVVDVVVGVLTAILLGLVVFEELAGAMLDDSVLLELVVFTESVVFAELVDEDEMHPLS